MSEPSPVFEPPGPSRDHVARLFDRIAGRYDLVNRVLSFRVDVGWRKRLVAALPAEPRPLRVLDAATGTADVPVALSRHARGGVSGAGIDPSGGMLALGQKKLRRAGLQDTWELVRGDARALPCSDASFDAVTIAFGIRNVPDPIAGLREMKRVLKPGGTLLVLEFSMPTNPLFRPLYLLYFRHILPLVGGLISGDRAAYRYLNQTVESFPHGPAFLTLMKHAGFREVSARSLTMGIASLYRGVR